MSSNYNWIFELTDKVTKPIKNIKDNLGSLHQDLKKNNKGFDEVGSSINDLKSKLEGYKKARDESFRGDHIRKYNSLIEKTTDKLQKLEKLPPKKHSENWQNIALGFNQTLEIVNKLTDSLAFTSEVKTLETDLMRYTDLTGSALDDAVQKSYTLSEVFDVNSQEVIRAANAMTDQMGGSFEDNLNLIQKGFEKGANLNNDMLHQLSEYGPQLKEAGLDGAQGLAIMAQAAKDGVYDDKAIDAIKEAGLSIREMGKNQVTALAGIGIEANDLLGKSTFESMQLISQSMQGADEQAKQLVLADIFKGAGEDAGAGFIEGLGSMNLNLDEIPTVQQSNQGLKEFVANIKASVGQAMGSFTPYIGTIAQAATGIMAMVEMSKSLSLVSKVQALWTGVVTAAQWALNIAMTANPIGLIIVGIGALIAGIAWLTDGFSGFGEYFTTFWNSLTEWFFTVVEFWATYLNPFGWLIELIDYVFPGAKKAIFGFFGDVWEGVYDLFVQPFIDAWNWIADALGLGGETPKISGEVKHTVSTDDGETKTFGARVAEQKANDKVAGQYKGMPLAGTAPKAGGVQNTSSNKSGGFASAEKKEINTRIDSLVKNLNIHVPSMEMSKAKLQKMINEALVGAVRDFEVAI